MPDLLPYSANREIPFLLSVFLQLSTTDVPLPFHSALSCSGVRRGRPAGDAIPLARKDQENELS